ncbi:MAG: hypothetical protein Q9220_005409 [cf. Caloplaca sp. 1 TL-2023]
MADEDENTIYIPLQDQKVFGAGIRRERVKFVPSNSADSQLPSKAPRSGAGDRYLAIVFNKAGTVTAEKARQLEDVESPTAQLDQYNPDGLLTGICKICKLPVTTNDMPAESTENAMLHEASIVHQVCLEHSHPPSHLDRNRQGLKYLSSYGWDPDGRLGLGATGAGIREPIKAKPKYDTVGLGSAASASAKVSKEPLKRLDAKQTRKAEEQARKDRQRIQNMFYQHEDVARYLGDQG